MRLVLTAAVLAALSLAACEAEPPPAAAPEPPAASAGAPAALAAETPLACGDEIGVDAAAALVERCRQVSPATRPPCHAANPCALIEDEIARSCALFGDDDRPAACAG